MLLILNILRCSSIAMYEVIPPLSSPYASVCYIRSDWADGTASRSSGVVVGYNDVLTALHVVYQAGRGGWASKVTIIPAADTSPLTRPYGEFSDVGSMVGRVPDWDVNGDALLTPAESQGDLALLGMKSRIGDLMGWLPVVQEPNDFYGVMAGYPGLTTGLMAESVFADASGIYGLYDVQSGLGAGASGGPLLQTVNGVVSVAGVLSSGNSSNTVSTYAGLFTSQTWNWLNGAMAANDVLLPEGLPKSVTTLSGTLFTGGAGADTFTAGSGLDLLTGNGGNDTLDGGAGLDTAVYTGTRASYAVSVLQPLITVADSVVGRDGTDTLRNIERVKFSDVALAFDVSGSAGQAYRLYQTAFNRAPDVPGLGFQMKALDDGQSLAGVAQNFLASPEFLLTYGNLTHAQFVDRMYANVLHRAADAGGFSYYTGNLASGVNSRADVVLGFSESPENQAALIGVMQNGMVYTVS